MRLSNLAGAVLAAGTLAALVQPVDSQKVAQRPKTEAAKKIYLKTQISDLYERISKLEFDFEQSSERGFSEKIGQIVFDQILSLSRSYGISFSPNYLRVFALRDSIGADYMTEKYTGSIEFYRNGKALLWANWDNSSKAQLTVLPPSDKAQNLDDILKTSTGKYSGSPASVLIDDFDFWPIYHEIRKLNSEFEYLIQFAPGATDLSNQYNNFKTYEKAQFVGGKLARITDYVLSRYDVWFSVSEIRAASNRILINNSLQSGDTHITVGRSLAIFPDGRATFVEKNNEGSTFKEIFPKK